jgi:hypothetical protein
LLFGSEGHIGKISNTKYQIPIAPRRKLP